MNAANLNLVAEILLKRREDSVIQRTDYDLVCSLPGVGPKVTSIAFLEAFDIELVGLYVCHWDSTYKLLYPLLTLPCCFGSVANHTGTWGGLSCYTYVSDIWTLRFSSSGDC
jgi:hypothetical protein